MLFRSFITTPKYFLLLIAGNVAILYIPAREMGVYMVIFNFFITFPQIVNGLFGGIIVKAFYNNEAIYTIVLAGIFMFLGAISVLFVKDDKVPAAGPAYTQVEA